MLLLGFCMLLGLHDFGSMVLPSRVWGQLAITASTFAGSLKVTKPNPRERPKDIRLRLSNPLDWIPKI